MCATADTRPDRACDGAEPNNLMVPHVRRMETLEVGIVSLSALTVSLRPFFTYNHKRALPGIHINDSKERDGSAAFARLLGEVQGRGGEDVHRKWGD